MKAWLSTAALMLASAVQAQDNTTMYSNCSVSAYYASLSSKSPSEWTLEDLRNLITNTHRNVLPNYAQTQGGDDIYKALIDLDPGNSTGTTVHELYSDLSMPAQPADNPNTWERGDLWPVDRGALRSSPALTDIYGKRPVKSTITLKKADLFFGLCGTVASDGSCVQPATTETAPSTEQDGKIFAPPTDSRGDVARALFYTALRYESSLGLGLTDCPPFADTQFGYLSELLQWHLNDPVNETEVARNERGCSRWQGNRNPFVDYPQLVQKFFGAADSIKAGTYEYSRCVATTEAPTATPNECSSLQPGDLPFFLVNSDIPDQFVIFPLTNVPASVGSIYVTDNAWNGQMLADTEGTMEFSIPKSGLKAGQTFGCGGDSPFGKQCTMQKLFSLGTQGDQLLVYCLNANDQPHFLWGFSNNGNWSAPGLSFAEYGPTKSALPETLTQQGNVALPRLDNCLYKGVQSGFKSHLLASFANPADYVCNDQTRYEIVMASSGWMASSFVALAITLLAYMA